VQEKCGVQEHLGGARAMLNAAEKIHGLLWWWSAAAFDAGLGSVALRTSRLAA
jgi:hypothetical protein